jgi:hypothetical protein
MPPTCAFLREESFRESLIQITSKKLKNQMEDLNDIHILKHS